MDAGSDAGGSGGCPGWQDDAAGLCWEDPPLAGPLYWDQAQDYCAGLGAGWRLPTVDELRLLISAGSGLGDCAANETGGACGVTDPSCLSEHPCHDDCGACVSGEGPDDDPAGCYWSPALSGTCDWYWASSLLDGSATDAWYVAFASGQVFFEDGTVYDNEVRCVRPLTR